MASASYIRQGLVKPGIGTADGAMSERWGQNELRVDPIRL